MIRFSIDSIIQDVWILTYLYTKGDYLSWDGFFRPFIDYYWYMTVWSIYVKYYVQVINMIRELAMLDASLLVYLRGSFKIFTPTDDLIDMLLLLITDNWN